MSKRRRNIQEVTNHLNNIESVEVPRWVKVGAGALAVAWWLSPIDDTMVPPLLLLDEVALTALATWVRTDNCRTWLNNRRAKKSIANNHTDQPSHR